jgi:hypothetical protein
MSQRKLVKGLIYWKEEINRKELNVEGWYQL